MSQSTDPTLLYTPEELTAIAAAIDQALTFHDVAPERHKLSTRQWTTLVTALRKTRVANLMATRAFPHGPYRHNEPTNKKKAEQQRRKRKLQREKDLANEAQRRRNGRLSRALRFKRPNGPPRDPGDLPR